MTARILIVDDVPLNVKLLEAKLSAEYFQVHTAFDGPSALEVAAAELPDLILLDVMMPRMDGFEVCRRLKSDPLTRHIPVVMVTALSDVADRVRGLEAGADDFLTKPVNDLSLFARVRSLTRLKVMLDELRVREATIGADDVLDGGLLGGEEEASNARILIVDSHEHTVRKMSSCLGDAGHQVDCVATIADGLAQGRQRDYDLIAVNLEVAGEDGLRLCSQLRSQEETRHVPILLILEEQNLPQLTKGLDLGVNDYLIKPIDSNELLARSRSQIRHRRYHDRLHAMIDRSVSMACTDELTGIFNRRYLNAHLDRRIGQIAESAKPVSILVLDTDHFKMINDTHGHASGDDVLRELTRRISDGLRESDMVARYGGEEFVVVLPDTPDDPAYQIAERVRGQIAERPFAVTGNDAGVTVTVSIGVATTLDASEEAGKLLIRADEALYRAKESGRNCVVASESDEATTGRRAAPAVDQRGFAGSGAATAGVEGGP
jgi:two-component system cell cycle response regulator